MKKDSYYFPHFCNARHDRKIRRVRKELGVEGYGIYFMILEVLREQTDFKYPVEDIDLLAEEFGTSEQKVRIVICNYDLFTIDFEEKFFSPKLILYLQPYFDRSEKARKAAQAKWKKINKSKQYKQLTNNAQAMPEHSTSNASKVNKVKEINKEKNIIAKQSQTTKLYTQIKDSFESVYGNFPNYGKEGKSIKELEKKFDHSPEKAKQIIELFYDLKKTGSQYWNKQPFLPSTLNSSGIWSRVLEEMPKEEDTSWILG